MQGLRRGPERPTAAVGLSTALPEPRAGTRTQARQGWHEACQEHGGVGVGVWALVAGT